MMRKFTYYLLAFFAIFFVNGCNEEDVSSPPSSSFTVDKTSGLTDTEFTFVVDQVGAKSIALLPYGTERANLGGILITSFTDGKATVKFTYSEVGTFNAVVVTTNYSSDGEEVKRSYSATTAVTIKSNLSELTSFKFEKSTKDSIADDHSVWVTVPFGSDVTTLKAFFGASPFSVVKVGSVTQETEKTPNNFTGPVTYSVTSNDGTSTTDYIVHVSVTPKETDASVKSASAKSIGKSNKDKVYPAFIDNAGGRILVLLADGTTNDDKDSLRFGYAMNGTFAKMEVGPGLGTEELKQDSLLNLKPFDGFGVITITEDSATVKHNYKIQAAVAPTLTLSFGAPLTPVVNGTTTGFDISLKVLNGTPLGAIKTTATVTGGSSKITSTTIKTAKGLPFSSGGDVDYSGDPVEFTVEVVDSEYGTYTATFTATVTVLK